jgi:integrase
MHPDVRAVLGAMHAQVPKVVADGQATPRETYVFCWPGGNAFTPGWVSHEFARLVEKAGVAHCTLHDLRRSFSTIAQRCGVDKYTVKDLGG